MKITHEQIRRARAIMGDKGKPQDFEGSIGNQQQFESVGFRFDSDFNITDYPGKADGVPCPSINLWIPNDAI